MTVYRQFAYDQDARRDGFFVALLSRTLRKAVATFVASELLAEFADATLRVVST